MVKGKPSELGWIAQYSVLTMPQPPLGLHAAHRGQCMRTFMPHARTMRHLVEAIGGGDGAEFEGGEEEVETGIDMRFGSYG